MEKLIDSVECVTFTAIMLAGAVGILWVSVEFFFAVISIGL